MNKPMADDELADKPLDPAVERVRRKLVRFAVINIGILLVALAAVVGALAWRTASGAKGAGDGAPVEATLLVPAGAVVLNQSLGANEISLLLQGADGSRFVLVFDRAGRQVGRYAVVAQ